MKENVNKSHLVLLEKSGTLENPPEPKVDSQKKKLKYKKKNLCYSSCREIIILSIQGKEAQNNETKKG